MWTNNSTDLRGSPNCLSPENNFTYKKVQSI